MKIKYIFLFINLFFCINSYAQGTDTAKATPKVNKTPNEIKRDRILLAEERKEALKERQAELKQLAKERKKAAAAKQKERAQKAKELAKERAEKTKERSSNTKSSPSSKGNGGTVAFAVITSPKKIKTINKKHIFKNYDGAQVERSMNLEKNNIFEISKPSEKNRKESAVILAYSVNQEMEQNQVKRTTRKRIYLNSKGAIDQAANFTSSFIGKPADNLFFMKIIKPSGISEYVNFGDAIVDSTLLGFERKSIGYYTFFFKFDFKVAVPNLELGDILEIGSSAIVKEKIARQTSEYAIKQIFPVENLQYKFSSPKAYKILCKPTNTAITPIVDTVNGSKNTVTFNAKDLEKYKSEKWKRSRKQDPYFNIVVEKKIDIVKDERDDKRAEKINNIASGKIVIKPKFKKGDKTVKIKLKNPVKYAYRNYLSDDERQSYINNLIKNFTTKGIFEPKKVREVGFKSDYLPVSVKKGPEYKETILLYMYNIYRNHKIQTLNNSNERMLDKMSNLAMIFTLTSYDIPFKILVTNNKYGASKTDLIDVDDLDFALLVDDKPIYPSFGHSKLYDVNPDYEGQEFWIYELNEDNSEFTLDTTKTFTQPVSTYNEHTQVNNYSIKVDKDFKNLIVEDKAVRTGQFTSGMRGYLFGTKDTIPEVVIEQMLKSIGVNERAILNFKRKFSIGSFAEAENIKGSNRGFYKKHLGRIKEEKSNIEQNYFYNSLKDMLNDEYGTIDTLLSYKNTKLGLLDNEKGIEYEANFELENRIDETVDGQIVYLGSVIGSQAEIAFEEKIRESDVHFINQRKLENTITFEIPQGYRVTSLEDFNMKVDNQFGSFISNAKQTGNQIIINTTKIYKVNSLEKKDWDQLRLMLDAAYNFSQKKIVLTR
jgi:hypothetical protein